VTRAADLAEAGIASDLIASRPDIIVHLAAIVSGEAEADFDRGYRINLDATRALFEAVRQEGLKSPYVPRLVFTSSIAVFGAPFPDKIGDEFFTTPLTSYGTQKAIGELLLSDYSRRGFFASRSPGRKQCCRSRTRCAIGMRHRAPQWASCAMR
jgi:nucleoside-diphosphate-sugar epimerase